MAALRPAGPAGTVQREKAETIRGLTAANNADVDLITLAIDRLSIKRLIYARELSSGGGRECSLG